MPIVTPQDVQPLLSGPYRSIDLRTASVKTGDPWEAVVSTLRMSRLAAGDLKRQHEQIFSKWGKVRTEGFSIDLEAREIKNEDREHTSRLLEQCDDGDSWTRLDDPAASPLVSEDDWPAIMIFKPLEAGTGTRLRKPLDIAGEELLLRSGTFSSAYDAINVFLDMVKINEHSPLGLYVKAPVYARIASLDVGSSAVSVATTYDSNFGPFRLSVVVRDREGRPKASRNFDFEKPGEGSDSGGFCTRGDIISEISLDYYDNVGVILYGPSSMVTLDDRHVDIGGFRAHKQSLERPLASIFPHFCNWDELQSLLTSKTAQTHEHAVSALLALIGLHSIQLGKASHERYDGSADVTVDVLAYWDVPPRTVFLVGCTTGDPKASDLNSLTRAATRVGQDIQKPANQAHSFLRCPSSSQQKGSRRNRYQAGGCDRYPDDHRSSTERGSSSCGIQVPTAPRFQPGRNLQQR